MSIKDDLINNLHEIYGKDKLIQEVFNSIGVSIDEVTDALLELYNNMWFDTMDLSKIAKLEKDLDFKTNTNSSIKDRRSQLQARWKSTGRDNIELLQAVANSWKNGEIQVQFIDGKIHVKFVGEFGSPSDLQSLQQSLEEIKPAHLALLYAFKYLRIRDIHNVMSLRTLQQQKLRLFAFGSDENTGNFVTKGILSTLTYDELALLTYNELNDYIFEDRTKNTGILSDYTNQELYNYTNQELINYTYGN